MALPIIAGVALWKIVGAAVALGLAAWAIYQITKIIIEVISDVAEAVGGFAPLVVLCVLGVLAWAAAS